MSNRRHYCLNYYHLACLCLCASVVNSVGCSSREGNAASQTSSPSAAAAVEQPARVKVVRPTREHLKRVSTPQPAHVAPYEKTDIHAKVSGYVEMIGSALGSDRKPIADRDGPRPLDIGDRVIKGQVLAELSVPEMKQDVVRKAALVDKAQADLGQARAAVQAAQAQVVAIKAKAAEAASHVSKYQAEVNFHVKEYARYRQLSETKVLQADLVDQQENKLRGAEAQLAAAKNAVLTAKANIQVEESRLVQAEADEKAAHARLRVAHTELRYEEIMVDYATIRAPYQGIIIRRLVDTGTFVQSAVSGKAEPLFTVARVDRLRIVAEIPEAEAGLVKIGQSASFQLTAARSPPLTGKVVRFADALDPGTRTMRVEVELDTPPQSPPSEGGEGGVRLRPGMFGSGTISFVDIPEALTLPATALLVGKRPAVLSVEAGRVQRREIEIGYNDGVRVQITRGLDASAQVIADAKTPVREGQPVEIAK